METKLYSQENKEQGTYSLSKEIFGIKPSSHFLHEVITVFLSNRRMSSAHTKTRAEVSGTGKKPWKQKGTGRARHGSTRSPIWRTGGLAFGPRNEKNYKKSISTNKKKVALAHALSAKNAEDNLIVVDSFDIKEAKTQVLVKALASFNAGKKPILILNAVSDNIALACRNIVGLRVFLSSDLNAYEVLNSSKIIFTKEALDSVSENIKSYVVKKTANEKKNAAESAKLAAAKKELKKSRKKPVKGESK